MFTYKCTDYGFSNNIIKTKILKVINESESGVLSFSEVYDSINDRDFNRLDVMDMVDELSDRGILKVYNCESEDEPAYALTKKGKAVVG